VLDELGRRQAGERRVRPVPVVVDPPGLDRGARMEDRREDMLVEQLVAKAGVELSTLPFCVGLPGSMKFSSTSACAAQPSIALLVNSEPLSNLSVGVSPRSSASL
jgi:hypothetical protein